MMKSIQARLIFAITTMCALLLSVMGVLLYHSMSSHLTRQFDDTLKTQAQAISSFVNQRPNGKLDFDYNEAGVPEYRSSPHGQYFIIRFDDGRIFNKSGSFTPAAEPEVTPVNAAQDVTLSGGRRGRGIRINFVPEFDRDDYLDDPNINTAHPGPAEPMNIVLTRDRSPLDDSLQHIFIRLVIGIAGVAIAIAGAVTWIVRGSLSPLRHVATRAGEIDARHLHLRLPGEGLPTELAPISSCLNDLLERLDQAFTRERRFTSDVAHELRTPIAELRTTVDVALRWPDDAGATRHALREAQQIAAQMQTLVQTLLDLVRSERSPQVPLSAVPLLDAVARAVRATEALGVEKGVTVEIPDYVTVMAEPTLLGSVLANILSNALEYSDGDEPIRCKAYLRDAGWLLTIENRASQLTPEDIRHMRDPFWRKDPARTASCMHTGLGLALVDSFCRLMNVKVDVELRSPQTFCLLLSFAGGPPRTTAELAAAPSLPARKPPVGYAEQGKGEHSQ